MQNNRSNLFTRDDTFFGVCEALGEDFGFNANWLRVALALALFWNPAAVIAGYLAAGLLVAVSRWLYPNPCPAEAEPVPAPAAAEQEMAAAEAEREPALLAA